VDIDRVRARNFPDQTLTASPNIDIAFWHQAVYISLAYWEYALLTSWMTRETDFSSPKRFFDVLQYDLHRLYVSSVSPLIPT
jgi:hypothetical protein